MSLQNKNNQFLSGQSNVNDQDDVVDIFDQYGAGDPVNSVEAPTASVPEFVQKDMVVSPAETRVADDVSTEAARSSEEHPVADVHADMPVQNAEKEKTWEAEYEGGNEAKVSIEKNVVKNEPEVQKVPDPVVQAEKKVEERESQKEAAVVEEESVESVEPAMQSAVAAPLKENINAVVQSESTQELKNSFVKTQKQTEHREFKIDPSKKTIAIVDDDVDTLDMYASIFEMADYNVIRASDGLEALSVISDHTPHLIFTGIVMPRMDGFAMMEALRQNKRTADIPVVINSHLGREADRKRAEELGAKDFIIRGFTPPREVLERIGALLLRSEYTFRFDINDEEARKLVKDLGASSFFVCPRGQEMVIKLSITDPKELLFSARFSCMDQKKKDS